MQNTRHPCGMLGQGLVAAGRPPTVVMASKELATLGLAIDHFSNPAVITFIGVQCPLVDTRPRAVVHVDSRTPVCPVLCVR
jgi:hypothetical protein